MSIIDRTANIRRLGQRLRQFARYSLGRVLGSVPNTNGAYKYFVDAQERSLFMRAEINALTGLLLKKGVFKESEWSEAWERELELYIDDQQKIWPEITVAEDGMSFSLNTEGFGKRCRDEGWPP